jgi:hypothetical protein
LVIGDGTFYDIIIMGLLAQAAAIKQNEIKPFFCISFEA